MQVTVIPYGPYAEEPVLLGMVSRFPLPESPVPARRESAESSFLAVVYPTRKQAGRVLKALRSVHTPKLVDLDEAVCVTRNKRGRTRLQELGRRRKKNTIGDSVAGMLAGAILLAPLDGSSLAVATEAVRYKTANVSLPNEFVQAVRALMQPDSSTIFLLVQRVPAPLVIPRITPYGGSLLETDLPQADRTRLEAVAAAGIP